MNMMFTKDDQVEEDKSTNSESEEVPTEQNRIVLSERDFVTFVEAINSPPKLPTPGLREAIAERDRRYVGRGK